MLEKFYIYAIHIIYGIILTQSFEISTSVFIPISQIPAGESWIALVNGLAIILTQYIMISGWINYTVSINKRPHKIETLYGNFRFGVDLVITFIVFYLISLTTSENFENGFWESFIWVIPTLFGLFMIWDYLKSKEYSNDYTKTEQITETNQRYKTFYAFLATIIVLITFGLSNNIFLIHQYDIMTLYLVFIIIMFGLNTWYRIIKNNITRLRLGWTTSTEVNE
jgi:hypothetical protein